MGNIFWSNVDISKCWCDLVKKVKVTKILLTLFPFQAMCLWKFDQNPYIGSEDRVWESSYVDLDTDADKICTKTKIHHFGWGDITICILFP